MEKGKKLLLVKIENNKKRKKEDKWSFQDELGEIKIVQKGEFCIK